jgi:hypothetical protein
LHIMSLHNFTLYWLCVFRFKFLRVGIMHSSSLFPIQIRLQFIKMIEIWKGFSFSLNYFRPKFLKPAHLPVARPTHQSLSRRAQCQHQPSRSPAPAHHTPARPPLTQSPTQLPYPIDRPKLTPVTQDRNWVQPQLEDSSPFWFQCDLRAALSLNGVLDHIDPSSSSRLSCHILWTKKEGTRSSEQHPGIAEDHQNHATIANPPSSVSTSVGEQIGCPSSHRSRRKKPQIFLSTIAQAWAPSHRQWHRQPRTLFPAGHA